MNYSFIKEADGVYYTNSTLPLINTYTIAFLKESALKSKLKRARLCLHLHKTDIQHDMVIVVHRDSYVAPHRHLSQSETFILIEGNVNLLVFEENGDINNVINMKSFDNHDNNTFFYRMSKNIFHSLSLNSEFVVFIESTLGPFDLTQREHASWAPNHNDFNLGLKFIKNIVEKNITLNNLK